MIRMHMNEAARSNILDVLAKSQAKDGSFPSIIGNELFSDTIQENHTTFHVSLILLCLAVHKDTIPVKKIAKKALAFLLKEKNNNGTWNYLKKNSTDKNYPPDWDDTACALAALTLYKPELITGSVLRTITELLMHTEHKTGGPYYTWMVSPNMRTRWNDIDSVVNSNIAFFLKFHAVSLPHITALQDHDIEKNTVSSSYYRSPVVAAYFMSRSYTGMSMEKARENIICHQTPEGIWNNPLETACAVSALIRYQAPLSSVEKAIAYLVAYCEKNQWHPNALYVEKKGTTTSYCGSKALTAAVCYEALSLYDHVLERHHQEQRETTLAHHHHHFHTDIVAETLSCLPRMPYFQNRASYYIDRLTRKDPGNQITLLPYHFFSALHVHDAKLISRDLVVMLGVSNLLGWLSYRIYDDILDNEGHPEDLPLANTALRTLTHLFQTMLPHDQLVPFTDIMDGIEHANAWEREHCLLEISNEKSILLQKKTIPDFGDHAVLAEKSLGHALGPITLLLVAGYAVDSPEVQATTTFFRHYIIARQLNDDAHDWFSDLERGFLNSASVEVLKHWKRRHKAQRVSLAEDKEALQSLFWNTSILHIAKLIFKHITEAEQALMKNPALRDTTYLQSLLQPIRQATGKALKTRTQMLEFIESKPKVLSKKR